MSQKLKQKLVILSNFLFKAVLFSYWIKNRLHPWLFEGVDQNCEGGKGQQVHRRPSLLKTVPKFRKLVPEK